MTQLRDVAQQALEAIRTFREWEMGQDYHSDRQTVLARAFAAEEALELALKSDESRDMFLSAAIAGLLAGGTYHTLVPQRATDVADMVAALKAGEQK